MSTMSGRFFAGFAVVAFVVGLMTGLGRTSPDGNARTREVVQMIPQQQSPVGIPTPASGSLATLAKLSAVELVQILKESPPSDPLVTQILMLRLAEIDLEKAFAFPDFLSEALLVEVLEDTAFRDPSLALQQAMRAPTEKLRTAGVRAVLRAVLDQNPKQAVALVSELPDRTMAHSAFCKWASDEPEKADDIWALLPKNSFLYGYFVSNLAKAKASDDREAAIHWYHSNPQLKQSHWALQNLARSFHKEGDHQAGADWLLSLHVSSRRHSAMKELIGEWAGKDATAVLAWATKLPSGSLQSEAVVRAVSRMSMSSSKAALEVLEGIPKGNMRREAAKAVGNAWANTKPKAAVEWALTLNEDLRRSVLPDALKSWSRKDIHEAAETVLTWIGQLPEREVRELVGPVAQKFGGGKDTAAAATTWLNALPEGPIKDAAITDYAGQLVSHDPSSALAWTQKIASPSWKQQFAEYTLQSWRTSDPEAADAAAKALNLSITPKGP